MEEPTSTHDQECPALPASREASTPTLPPGYDFCEPDRHGSTRCVHADARCLLGVESIPRGSWRSIEAPRREPRRASSRSKRCETASDIEVVSGVATVLPRLQRTSMPTESSRKTDHRALPTRAGRNPPSPKSRSNQPVDDESPTHRKPEATDWTRPKSCPDWRPTTAMLPSPSSPHEYRTSFGSARTTRHPQMLGLPRPPSELRISPPRRVEISGSPCPGHSRDRGMSRVRTGWTALSGAQRETRRTLSTSVALRTTV